ADAPAGTRLRAAHRGGTAVARHELGAAGGAQGERRDLLDDAGETGVDLTVRFFAFLSTDTCDSRRRGRPAVVRGTAVGSLMLVLIGTGVRATTVEELCGPPVPDPCRITTPRLVDPGSVLDFRPGALVVATASGRLDAGPGTMAIVARDVTLVGGGRLLAA